MKNPENTAEFVQLLTSHQEVLRAYVTTLMPGRQDISDVLQDVNVKLWERQSTFKAGTNFGAWSCTMARYCVLSHRKKLKRQSCLLFSDELLEQLAAPATSGLHTESHQIKRAALRECLKHLKPKEVDLLRVRYDEDVSIVNHAKRVGGTARNLRAALHRIRLGLKDCVQNRQAIEGDLL